MIELDGSAGEGGGQVIRTALALSLITGEAVRIVNVRARRAKPGLQKQHQTAVLAAAQVGSAKVSGASIGSQEVEFWPGKVQSGEYRFDIATAGSTTLVLQTVLPPLMIAVEPSQLTIIGGTHNPLAPSAGFLQTAFAPLLAKFGPRLEIKADPFGFYPAGGGQLAARIEPASNLRTVTLNDRGPIVRRAATAYLAQLPDHIAARELDLVARRLGWHAQNSELRTVVLNNTRSPGNALEVTLIAEHAVETCFVCGERGKKAEHVAQQAVEEIKRYEQANVPIGEHLADQLLIPLALAGSGSFVTLPLSLHSTTNMAVIERFLPVKFETREQDAGRWQVSVRRC